MNDSYRSGDIVAAMSKIAALEAQLAAARAELARWKIEFSVDIVPETLDVVVTAVKPFGGGGVRKTLAHADIEYYAYDKLTLIGEVGDEIYSAMLKEVVAQELNPKLARAVDTVTGLNKKS